MTLYTIQWEHPAYLWGLAALFVATAELRVLTLGDSVPEADARVVAHVMRLMAFSLCIVLGISTRRRVHEAGLGIAILLMIARITTSYVAFGE